MPFRIVSINHFHCDAEVLWDASNDVLYTDGVIHAVSPDYEGVLRMAEHENCSSILIPLYGSPRTAVKSIGKYLAHSDLKVILAVPDRNVFQIGRNLDSYLNNEVYRNTSVIAEMSVCADSIDTILDHPGESFQTKLFRIIDEKGYSDPEVYRKANMDRKLFSKIRCNPDYIPKKKTVLSLAIALELNMDDAEDLLASAGYAFSESLKSDLIVRYCIEHAIYDIYEVNALLFQYKQSLLV